MENTKIEASKINNFPSFSEIDMYNEKTKYKGYELMIHLTDNLYVRISVQNESQIFNYTTDDILYFSLCTGNQFPIFNVSYKYCEEAYEAGVNELKKAINRIVKSLCDFTLKV